METSFNPDIYPVYISKQLTNGETVSKGIRPGMLRTVIENNAPSAVLITVHESGTDRYLFTAFARVA